VADFVSRCPPCLGNIQVCRYLKYNVSKTIQKLLAMIKEEAMSKRIDITNHIFNDIYVLKFERKKNTHAEYKCLCMLCNKIMYATYSNLKSGNTKSCQKCGQKTTNYIQELDINKRLIDGESIAKISRDLELSRGVIYRVKKEWKNYHN